MAAVPAHGRRRAVVVNGRRVKTVDVHAHCAVLEADYPCPWTKTAVDHILATPGLLGIPS